MDIYCGDGSILCYQCMSLMSEGSVASLGVCKEMTVYSLLSFVLYSVGWWRLSIFVSCNQTGQTKVEGKGRKRIRNTANWWE